MTFIVNNQSILSIRRVWLTIEAVASEISWFDKQYAKTRGKTLIDFAYSSVMQYLS